MIGLVPQSGESHSCTALEQPAFRLCTEQTPGRLLYCQQVGRVLFIYFCFPIAGRWNDRRSDDSRWEAPALSSAGLEGCDWEWKWNRLLKEDGGLNSKRGKKDIKQATPAFGIVM